jgi:hypothetical protein
MVSLFAEIQNGIAMDNGCLVLDITPTRRKIYAAGAWQAIEVEETPVS